MKMNQGRRSVRKRTVQKAKNLKLIAFSLLLSANCLAQQSGDSLINMSVEYSSENRELVELMRFSKIDYYKVTLTGAGLSGKSYSIVSKEIWNGKVKSTDTLLQTAGSPYLPKIANDTLRFSVIASSTTPGEWKINFDFGAFSLSNTFKCLRSENYSLIDRSEKAVIVPGKPFYAFAYILPIPYGEKQSFCAVDASEVPIENWGKELGLKHYILFEMTLE